MASTPLYHLLNLLTTHRPARTHALGLSPLFPLDSTASPRPLLPSSIAPRSFLPFSLHYGRLEGSRGARQVRVPLRQSQPRNFRRIYCGDITDNRLRL